jgi:hypothetical protein
MKRTVAAFVVVIALAGLAVAGDLEGTSYGKGVTIAEPTPIATLLAEPDGFVGKAVRVDGVITGVCEKRGCWMQVTDQETGQGIRIKVEDGVIVFPMESMGHRAAAEGTFEAVKLTPEQVAARAAAAKEAAAKEAAAHGHAPGEPCEKTGEPAAKAGCDAPVQNDTIYLIRGTGAVIQS